MNRPPLARRGLLALAAAETLAWAACYYSFPALLPHWLAQEGWSTASTATALTAALLVAALLGPTFGHLIDRGYGRSVMTAGSMLAAGALFGLSLVQELWQFHACWIILGVTQAAVLYEPCFSVLTRRLGLGAGGAITVVTLFAGFASSIAFPLAHFLVLLGDWRLAVQIFAILMLLVTPLFYYAIGPDRPALESHAPPPVDGRLPRGRRAKIMLLLALAFAMVSLNHGALISHMLPLLHAQGIAAGTAVFASSCIGPMQVAGRLLLAAWGRRWSPSTVILAAMLLVSAAATALYFTRGPGLLLVVFVVLQGGGYGMVSIARPRLVAHSLGAYRFGAVAGMLAIPHTAGYALAPAAAALLASGGSYLPVIASAGACGLLGAVAILAVSRLQGRAGDQKDTTS